MLCVQQEAETVRLVFQLYIKLKSVRQVRDELDRGRLFRRSGYQKPAPGPAGFGRARSTVARYMTKEQGPASQGWKTFLRNHAAGIASLDLFVVRTISFKSALWLGDSRPLSKANGAHQRDGQSDRRVDRRSGD